MDMHVAVPSPMETETVRVVKECCVCKHPAVVEVPRSQYDAWRSGMLAQDAFPDLSLGEREMLISGTHPECWKKLFG